MIKRAPKLPVAKSGTLAHPKPKDAPKGKQDAVKVYPGGREVCQDNAAGKSEYRIRTFDMAIRQNWICPHCKMPMIPRETTFQHGKTRGMGGSTQGGSFRDDRIDQPGNEAWHYWCNAIWGSRRAFRE